MWSPTISSDELYHHGILKMKWGVRNGPPYPLKPSDHSAAEKRAMNLGEKKKSHKIETNHQRVPLSNEEIERRKKIAKNILIGAGVVGTSAALIYAYKSGTLNQFVSNVKSIYSETGKKLTEDVLRLEFKKAQEKTIKDIGVCIKQGESVHRIHGTSNFDLSKVGSHMYGAFDKNDINLYKSTLTDWAGTGERYDVELEAIKDIIAPNKKATKQIIKSLTDNDEFMDSLKKTAIKFQLESYGLSGSDLSPNQEINKKIIIDGITKEFNKYSDEQKFWQAMWAVARNDETSKQIENAVKAKGYNALIDFYDRPSAKTPIIFLDPQNTLIKKGEHFVTNSEITQSAKEFVKNSKNKRTSGYRQAYNVAYDIKNYLS